MGVVRANEHCFSSRGPKLSIPMALFRSKEDKTLKISSSEIMMERIHGMLTEEQGSWSGAGTAVRD